MGDIAWILAQLKDKIHRTCIYLFWQSLSYLNSLQITNPGLVQLFIWGEQKTW